MTKATTTDQPTGATLETLILSNSYRERHQALMTLKAAIQLILHPRSTMGYGSGARSHFLPIPDQPSEDDKKKTREWTAELEAISTRERELTYAAQRIQQTVQPLGVWCDELATKEDQLLLSRLAPEDSPDVEGYIREHKRFLRTCQKAASELEM